MTREQLEKAKAWLEERVKIAVDTPYLSLTDAQTLQQAVDVALAALPKTKMVEVWRVEYAQDNPGGWCAAQCIYFSQKAADHDAEMMRNGRGYACIRVTGPHQQEVPA